MNSIAEAITKTKLQIGVQNTPTILASQSPNKAHDAKFFDGSNVEAKSLREQLALDTLEEIICWLKKGGKVAIHDATNTTVERRKALRMRVEKEQGIKCFFIESICPDPEVLQKNIEMKLSGPGILPPV